MLRTPCGGMRAPELAVRLGFAARERVLDSALQAVGPERHLLSREAGRHWRWRRRAGAAAMPAGGARGSRRLCCADAPQVAPLEAPGTSGEGRLRWLQVHRLLGVIFS